MLCYVHLLLVAALANVRAVSTRGFVNSAYAVSEAGASR
jgi:hypothetical protein